MNAAAQGPKAPYDLERVISEFPALRQEIHGHRLAYLDNAASTLKPQPVIDALVQSYSHDYSNIHRGVHELSRRSTQAFEAAREQVRAFINAPSTREVIFVRGCTEAINLVASAWGGANLGEGDEVLVSGLEHHSNIVPWQLICEATGAKLVAAPLTDAGEVTVEAMVERMGPRTKLVAVAQVSNALGTVVPVREIAAEAHARGALILVDGAQAVPHCPVDVQALGADFYAFSGHKMYGPSGIGVLYGRRELLEAMPPYHGGGDMILTVTFEESTWSELPSKFEAGTPHIAGAIGLGAACAYLSELGLERVAAWEAELLAYGTEQLSALPGLRLIGTAPKKAGVLGFVLEGIHPHDVGTILDRYGVAVRTGHHCAQPVMARYCVPATTRASLGVYNTLADIDQLVDALREVQKVFA